MAYKALYREYRPQTFDEVVGQNYIVKALKNAIRDNKVAHAYLFTGPRGTGKTTIAKLIAKALNCEGEDKPCGVCENCKAIANGSFSDVVEIDAASHNGVDYARELLEQVKFAPMSGKYKVYIIDEVHMMTDNAFNALLKTLEEPPTNVVFILATTEPNSVLTTIVSRCQRYDFSRVSKEDIERKLREVLHNEGMAYDDAIVPLIASLADGGVRDALSILDQVIAYSDEYIKEQDVRDVYGVVSITEAIKFIKQCVDGEVQVALTKLDAYDGKCIDIARFTTMLIDILKETIVFNKTNSLSNLSLLDEESVNCLSSIISSDLCFKFIDILLEALKEYKHSSSPRSFFELAILKMCSTKEKEDVVLNSYNEIKKEEVNDELNKQDDKTEENVNNVSELDECIPTNEYILNKNNVDKNVGDSDSVIIEDKPEEINEVATKETITGVIPEIQPESKVEEDNINKTAPETKQVLEVKPVILTHEIVMNFLVNTNKDIKIHLQSIWPTIHRYINIPKYFKAANLLRDGYVVAAGTNSVIICVETESEASLAMSPENYLNCKELLKELFNDDYIYICLSKDHFESERALFKKAIVDNKIPLSTPIEDLYDVEKLKYCNVEETKKEESSLDSADDIFGDLIK